MRPDPNDDSPEACAYRRAELAEALFGLPPEKVRRRNAIIRNQRQRDAAIAVRVEALRIKADQLEATITRTPTREERLDYIAAEWDRLNGQRNPDELARALGFVNAASLTVTLDRRARRRAAA